MKVMKNTYKLSKIVENMLITSIRTMNNLFLMRYVLVARKNEYRVIYVKNQLNFNF